MEALDKFVALPLNLVRDFKLTEVIYHDVTSLEWLTTNYNGIDIIGQQLQLIFENKKSIYIGWANIEGWMQYSLSVSEKSFCLRSEQFLASRIYWDNCIGKRFEKYEIYGYVINQVTSTNSDTGEVEVNNYYKEPHMLLMHFEEQLVAIANCYAEEDFVPKLAIGDGVWIMFNNEDIQACINKLSFEKLEA